MKISWDLGESWSRMESALLGIYISSLSKTEQNIPVGPFLKRTLPSGPRLTRRDNNRTQLWDFMVGHAGDLMAIAPRSYGVCLAVEPLSITNKIILWTSYVTTTTPKMKRFIWVFGLGSMSGVPPYNTFFDGNAWGQCTTNFSWWAEKVCSWLSSALSSNKSNRGQSWGL